MSEEEIISNIGEMLGTQATCYPQGLVVKMSEKDKNTIINLLDKYLSLKNKLSNTVPKQVIRDMIEEKQKKINKMHPASDCVLIDDLEIQIQVLKELLESEE